MNWCLVCILLPTTANNNSNQSPIDTLLFSEFARGRRASGCKSQRRQERFEKDGRRGGKADDVSTSQLQISPGTDQWWPTDRRAGNWPAGNWLIPNRAVAEEGGGEKEGGGGRSKRGEERSKRERMRHSRSPEGACGFSTDRKCIIILLFCGEW